MHAQLRRYVRDGMLVGLIACGACDSSDLGALTLYDVPSLVFDSPHSYANGDVGILRSRFTAAGAPVASDQPGLSCEPQGSSIDGTEFLSCARLYARQPGQAWQPVAMPITVGGNIDFLGQAADGTRYFWEVGLDDAVLYSYAPGETTSTRLALGRTAQAYLHPFGQLVVIEQAGARLVTGGIPGPPMLPSASQFDVSNLRNVFDRDGNYYVQTATGWDRVSPDNQLRDVDWFRRPATNVYNKMQGIGADGRLYARTIDKEVLAPAPDNTIEPNTLMALSPGDTSWTQVSESLGRYEPAWKDAVVTPARDGSWWLQTCVANCGGFNPATQTFVMHWEAEPRTVKVERTFSLTRPGTVVLTAPLRFSPAELVASSANTGCSIAFNPVTVHAAAA